MHTILPVMMHQVLDWKCSSSHLYSIKCCNLHPEIYFINKCTTQIELYGDLVEQTNLYANRDRGNLTFNVTHDEMRTFLGIVLFYGYHGVPSERDYWSSQPDLKVPFISDTMTRNKLLTLKSFIHLADNDHLQQGKKMAKVQRMTTTNWMLIWRSLV